MNDVFDYSALRGKIVEVYGSQEKFAKALGTAQSTLSLKLNNKAEFTKAEMLKTCLLLKIPIASITTYFFCLKTSEN